MHLRQVAIAVNSTLRQLDRAASVQWAHQSVLDGLAASKVGRWLLREFIDFVCAVCVFLSGQDSPFTVHAVDSSLPPDVHGEEDRHQDQEDSSYGNTNSHARLGTGGHAARGPLDEG